MDDTKWTTSGPGRPSLGELFSRLSVQTVRLVRAEIDLAKAELAQKATASAIGIGLFVAAAMVGFFAVAVLIATAILGLANAMPAWAAALVVAGLLLFLTAVLALIGKRSLDGGKPPTPSRTTENLKQDVHAIKEGLRS